MQRARLPVRWSPKLPKPVKSKDSFSEQRLAVINLTTGSLRQISPADTYIYEYSWSPDNQHLAVTSAQGNGDNNWYIAELNILDATTGLMNSIYKPQLQIARPAWSPDGKTIAFVEGLMSDEPSVGGDVFSIPAAGGTPKNLTPDRKASASQLTWTNDGKLFVTEYLDAESSVSIIDPADAKVSNLWRGVESVSAGDWGPNISVSADGTSSAVIRDSFSDPPEIWAGAIGRWKQITERNKDLKPGLGQGRQHSVGKWWFHDSGLADLSARFRSCEKISHGRRRSRRPRSRGAIRMARRE